VRWLSTRWVRVRVRVRVGVKADWVKADQVQSWGFAVSCLSRCREGLPRFAGGRGVSCPVSGRLNPIGHPRASQLGDRSFAILSLRSSAPPKRAGLLGVWPTKARLGNPSRFAAWRAYFGHPHASQLGTPALRPLVSSGKRSAQHNLKYKNTSTGRSSPPRRSSRAEFKSFF
jgi:hypothetical protein